MKTNYFRQDIWINIWIQFHLQYIFEGRDDFIHTRHIIVPPQRDCCKLGPPWSIKHVGTSWTLFCKRKLRYLGSHNLEDKYFHISNCIFTMKGWTVKKIILRCFFATGLFYLHEKFQLSQSSPSCILSKKWHIFYHICGENIFPAKCLWFYTSQKKFIRFGSKLSKN